MVISEHFLNWLSLLYITEAVATIGPLYHWLISPLAEAAVYPDPKQANKDIPHTPRYLAAQQTLEKIAQDQVNLPMEAILTNLSIKALAPQGLTSFIATATGTKDAVAEAQALVVQLVASHHASWVAFDELQQQAITNLYDATGLPQPPPHSKERYKEPTRDPNARLWSSSAQRDASLGCKGRTCQNQGNATRTQGHQTLYHIPMLESLVCRRCRNIESDRALLQGILEASKASGLNDPTVKVWPQSDTHIFHHVKNLPSGLSARDVAGLSVIDATSYANVSSTMAAGQIHALTWLAYLRVQDPPKPNHDTRHTLVDREIQRLCYALPQQHRPPITEAQRTALRIPPNMPSYPDPYLTPPTQTPQRCESVLCREGASLATGKTAPKWRPDFQSALCDRCTKRYARCRLYQQLKQAATQIMTQPIPPFLVKYAQDLPAQAKMKDTCGIGHTVPPKLKPLKAATGALALIWMTHCSHIKTTDSMLESFFTGKDSLALELWPKDRPQPQKHTTKKKTTRTAKKQTTTMTKTKPHSSAKAMQRQADTAKPMLQRVRFFKKNKRWKSLKKAKMCGRGCTGWQQRPTSHDLTQDEARTELLGATKADLVDILKGRVIAHGGSKGDLAKRLQDSIDTGRPLTDAERLSIPHHNDAHQHKATCPMFQSTPGTSSKFKPKLPRPRVLPPIAMTNRLPQLGSQPRIAGSRRQTPRNQTTRTPRNGGTAQRRPNNNVNALTNQRSSGVARTHTVRPPNAYQGAAAQQRVQQTPPQPQPPANWPPDPHI